MKIAVLDPAVAFPHHGRAPDDHELDAMLGDALAPIAEIMAKLCDAFPGATAAWHYSDRSGWYRIVSFKQRRLFYLVPQPGNFRLSLLIGPRAIASLAHSPSAPAIVKLLKSATCYAEGTAVSFDRVNCDPDIVLALLAAKLAH